ncbi:MAG: dTMP kinase [Actinomycetota bacterium]
MSRGVFVAFEGIDASGKSTVAKIIAERYGATFTIEPGGTPLGVELRKWLLDAGTPMKPESEALLMLADRSHHVFELIEPALASGQHIVTDRYYASTLAYQGYGRGLNLAELRAATDLAIGSTLPDLTILIDLSVEAANERRERDTKDRFESADENFHERVRQGYLEMATTASEKWVVIDGAGTVDEVVARVEQELTLLPWNRD